MSSAATPSWEILRSFKPTETGTVGRPLLCSTEIATKILENLAAGSYLITACEAAGVSYSAVRKWMLQAKEDQAEGKLDTPYVKFSQELARAEHMAEQALVQRLNVAEDWRAQAFLLERGPGRNRWGKQEEKQQLQQVLVVSDELAKGMLEALQAAARIGDQSGDQSAQVIETTAVAIDSASEGPAK